jgi:hypothetical protein
MNQHEAPARRAACACGQLAATTAGEPIRVSICHCLECQRRTGSVFGAQARFHAAAVQVTGDAKTFVRTGDSGAKISFRFCGNCGSTVWYTLEAQPEIVAIPVGAFADPGFPAPIRSVYEQRMHGWIRIPEAIEREP